MIHKLVKVVVVTSLLTLSFSSGDARTVEKRFSILGLGDSITEGGKEFHSYLYPLWERLFAAGYNSDFIGPRQSETRIGMIKHFGNSGKPVEFMEERIDSVYRQYPADIVLLHAGHNHFAEQNPIDGIMRAYASIVRKIHAVNPQAHIFLAQVTPSGKLPKYSYIPELNRRIAAFVSYEKNRRLHLVDMATGHDYRTMTIYDHVHPNDLGAERMAERWFEAISKVFKPHRKAYRPDLVSYSRFNDDTSLPTTSGEAQSACSHDLNMHVFRARGKKNPAIVYFFAGGWKFGSPLQFYRECEWHQRKGYTAISVDYRIGYLHHSSAQDATNDGIASIRYIRQHADELGIDTTRIIVAGASAGATIAGKIPDELICARMLYYPVTDSLATERFHMYKPVLFMIGTNDNFTPIDKARQFANVVSSTSVLFNSYFYEGYGHPLFRYRESLPPVFYTIRQRTDLFLQRIK